MAVKKYNYNTPTAGSSTSIDLYYRREPFEDFAANIEERVKEVGGKGITVDVLPFEKEGFARLGIRQGGKGQTLEIDVAPGLMTRHGPTIESPTKGGYAAVFRAEGHLPSPDQPAQFGSPYEKFGQYVQGAFDPTLLQILDTPNKVWQATVVEGYQQGKLPFGLAGRLPQVGPDQGLRGLAQVHGSVGISFGSAVKDWTAGLNTIFRQVENAPVRDPRRNILGMAVSPTAKGLQLIPAALPTRTGEFIGPHEKLSGLIKHRTQMYGRAGETEPYQVTANKMGIEPVKPGAITSFEDVGWRTPNYVPVGTNEARPVLVRANEGFGGALFSGEKRIFDPRPAEGIYAWTYGKQEHTQLKFEHMSQLAKAEFEFGIMKPVYEGKGDERTLTGYKKVRELEGTMVRPGENPIIATYTTPGKEAQDPPVINPIHLGTDLRERQLTGQKTIAIPEGARTESGRGFSGVPFDAQGVELFSQGTRERLDAIFSGNVKSARHGAWFSAGVNVLTYATPKTQGVKAAETVESGIQQLYPEGVPRIKVGDLSIPQGSITDALKSPLEKFEGELMTLPVENLTKVWGLLGGKAGKAAQELIMKRQRGGAAPGQQQMDFMEKTGPRPVTGDELAKAVKDARGEQYEQGVSGYQVVEELYNKVADMPFKESWEMMRRGRMSLEDVRGAKPKDLPLLGIVTAEDKPAWTQEMMHGAALGPEGKGGVTGAQAQALIDEVFHLRPIYRKGKGVSFTQGPTVDEMKVEQQGIYGAALKAAGIDPETGKAVPGAKTNQRRASRLASRYQRLTASLGKIEAGELTAPSEPVAYEVRARGAIEVSRTANRYVAEWMAKGDVGLGFPEQHALATIFPETAENIGVLPRQQQKDAGRPPRRSQTWKEMYDVFSHTMSHAPPDERTELTPDLKRRVREQQASGEKLNLPEWSKFLGGKGPIYNPTTGESYPRPETAEAAAVDKYGLAELTDPLNYLARNYGELMWEAASDLTREGEEIGQTISKVHGDMLSVFESASGNWQKSVGSAYVPGQTFGRMGSIPAGVKMGQALITRGDIDAHVRSLAREADLPATPRNIRRWTKQMMADPYIETLIGRVPDTSTKHGWVAAQGVTAEQIKQRTGLDVPKPGHIGRGGRLVEGHVEQAGKVISMGHGASALEWDFDADPAMKVFLKALKSGNIESVAGGDVAAYLARSPREIQLANEQAKRETIGEEFGVPSGKYNVAAGSMAERLWSAFDIDKKSGLVVPRKEIERLPAVWSGTSGEVLGESLKQRGSKGGMGQSYMKRQSLVAAGSVGGASAEEVAAGQSSQLLGYQAQLDLKGLGPTRYESMLQSVIFAKTPGGNEAQLLARGSEKAEGHGEIWRSGGTGQWWKLQEGLVDQFARAFGRDVSEGRITPGEAAFAMHMPGSKQFSAEAIEKDIRAGNNPQEVLRRLLGQERHDVSAGGGLSFGERYDATQSPAGINLLYAAARRMLGGGGKDPRLIKTDKGEMVEAMHGVSKHAFPTSETGVDTVHGAMTSAVQRRQRALTEIQQKKTGVVGDPTKGVYDIKTRARMLEWGQELKARGDPVSKLHEWYMAKFTSPGDPAAAGTAIIPTMTGSSASLQASPTYPVGATSSGIQQPRAHSQVRGAPVFQVGGTGGVPPLGGGGGGGGGGGTGGGGSTGGGGWVPPTPPIPPTPPLPSRGGAAFYGGTVPPPAVSQPPGAGNQGASMPYMQMQPGSDPFNKHYQAVGQQMALGAANVEQSMRVDNYHWGAGKARALAGRQIRTAVSAIGEAGDTQAKSAAAVGKIAAALGVPPEELTKENVQRYLSGDPTGKLGPVGAGLDPADRSTRELFREIESQGKASALQAKQVEIGDAAVQSKRGNVGTEPEDRQLVEKGLLGAPSGPAGMREAQILQNAEEWAKTSGVRGTPGAKDFDARNLATATAAAEKWTAALDKSEKVIKKWTDAGKLDTPQAREEIRQATLSKKIAGLERTQAYRQEGIQDLQRGLERATIAGDTQAMGAIGTELTAKEETWSKTQDQIGAMQRAKTPLTGGEAASSTMRRLIGGWGLFYMGHLMKMGMGPMKAGYEEYQQYAEATQQAGVAAFGAGQIAPRTGAEWEYQQAQLRTGGGMFASLRRLSAGVGGTPIGDLSTAAMAGLGGAGMSMYIGGAMTAEGMPVKYQQFGKKLGGAALPIGLAIGALSLVGQQISYQTNREDNLLQTAAIGARGDPLSPIVRGIGPTIADWSSGRASFGQPLEYAPESFYAQELRMERQLQQFGEGGLPVGRTGRMTPEETLQFARSAGMYGKLPGAQGLEAGLVTQLTMQTMQAGYGGEYVGAIGQAVTAGIAVPEMAQAIGTYAGRGARAPFADMGKMIELARDLPIERQAMLQSGLGLMEQLPGIEAYIAREGQVTGYQGRSGTGQQLRPPTGTPWEELSEEERASLVQRMAEEEFGPIEGRYADKFKERWALQEQRRALGLETELDQEKYRFDQAWTPEETAAWQERQTRETRGATVAQGFAQMGFTQGQYAPMVEQMGATPAGMRQLEGIVRRDPIVLTEMAMRGDFGDQEFRGMPLNELLASADIDSGSGLPTGRPWGTTNLQRGNVSAEQIGAKIFNMNVDTLSVRTITTPLGGPPISLPGTAALGGMGDRSAYTAVQGLGKQFQGLHGDIAVPEYMQGKGGMVALQWEQKELAFEHQTAMFGVQRQQLELQARYQPQFWAIEDQQMQLQYNQAMYGFAQQRQQLQMQSQQFYENMGLQRERGEWGFQYQQMQMGMQRQQFQETQGLQWRQAQWGFESQQRQFDMQGRQFGEQQELQRRGSMMQRGWTQRDWQYEDQMRGMQWGWKQEDFQEEVRFMSGRQRTLAERGMERETTVFNIEGDRIDEQRDRQKELWALEDERFDMVIRHNEEQRELQQKNMEMQKAFFEEGFELRAAQFEQQQELAQLNLEKQIEFFEAGMALQIQHHEEQVALQMANIEAQQAFFLEGYALREEAARLQREYWEEQHALSLVSLGIQEKYAAAAKALADNIATLVEEQGTYQGLLAAGWSDVLLMLGRFFTEMANAMQAAIDSLQVRNCFVPGTPISTVDGEVPIEDIVVGDEVFAYDEQTASVCIGEVTATYINNADTVAVVHTEYSTFMCTPNHRFYTASGEWVCAKDLRSDDLVLLENRMYSRVIEVGVSVGNYTVHNFTVGIYHTYFVDRHLVHNYKPEFAAGGHPVPGQPVIVGEKGPEVYTPGIIGTVSPLTGPSALMDKWQNSMTMTTNFGGGGDGSRTIVINIGNRRLGTYVIDAFTNELEVV